MYAPVAALQPLHDYSLLPPYRRYAEPLNRMPSLVDLTGDIKFTKTVGPVKAGHLARLNIVDLRDLLTYYPRKYIDRRECVTLDRVFEHPEAYLFVTVDSVEKNVFGRRRLFKAMVSDDTGSAMLTFFNQLYLAKVIFPGTKMVFSGRPKYYRGRLTIAPADFEILQNGDSVHFDRILPVYRSTSGLYKAFLRDLVFQELKALPTLDDYFSGPFLAGRDFPSLSETVRGIHFPETEAHYIRSRQRLVYEDFLFLQVLLQTRRDKVKQHCVIRKNTEDHARKAFVAGLPFALTTSQETVLAEVTADLKRPVPMRRLVQGDVGCGKTVIALDAAWQTVLGGGQAVLMAPTEILARQHYETACRLYNDVEINVGLILGAMDKKKKQAIVSRTVYGDIGLLVGTHAVFQEKMAFAELRLVIIDEQHRFGTAQRAAIIEKGSYPDILIMSATPIPRTLAETIYGDLDISEITGLPPARRPVKTKWLRAEDAARAYDVIRGELSAGHQVYIVYPRVLEGEEEGISTLMNGLNKVKQRLPQATVAVLYGGMAADEKEKTMAAFYNGSVQILVATSVIEVGIDNPNATLIVVVNADRFGLAQLHQLRGRVGRGTAPSMCLLITAGNITAQGQERMEIMTRHANGFDIAEMDLSMRGTGEVSGIRQSGSSEFRFADYIRDRSVLAQARAHAQGIVAGTAQDVNRQLLYKTIKYFYRDSDLALGVLPSG